MTNKLNVLCVFGTRPEVIKMAPVVKELKKYPAQIDCKVCITGQHREMIDSLLGLFDINSNYDLNLMRKNQNLEHITTTVLHEVGQIIDKEQTDCLLVQGDTTTGMAASLAAFYKKIKIGHIEAGLRTWNKYHPYPEDVNRKIIDSLSDVYFVHTNKARENLLNEGVDPKNIEVTGNTVIDALLEMVNKDLNGKDDIVERLSLKGRKIILMTAHRRENIGDPIKNICMAVRKIADKYKNEVSIVYPVHLNPNIKVAVHSIIGETDNIKLIEPLEYHEFVHAMKQSYLILTDSGGLQEEAPSLGKPVLVLRETTERPEGVDAGCVEVIGTEVNNIVNSVSQLIDNSQKYEQMSKSANPYGDGKAAERIVARLLSDSKNRNIEL